jgi:hypothetical protein
MLSALFFSATLCFGAPSSLRGDVSTFDFDKGKVLSTTEMRADLDYYSFAITKAYAGFQFVPDKGSQALLDLYKSWMPPLKMSSHSFLIFLHKNAGIVKDNHFVVASLPSIGLPEERPIKPRSGRGVGSNFGEHLESAWEFNWYDVDHTIPVVSIHFFPPSGNDWRGFLNTIKMLKHSVQNIIIDLRDNDGGDDHMGAELAKLLLDSAPVPTSYKSTMMTQNEFSLEIWLNSLDYEVKKNLNQGHDVTELRKYRQQIEDKLIQAKAGALTSIGITNYTSNMTSGPDAYSGHVFVIINRIHYA